MKSLLIVAIMAFSLFANERIRVQLDWRAQFEFAAFYMAKEYGFYEEAGLDVELRHLDPEHPVDILDQIDKNKVDIAVYYPSIIPVAAKTKKYVILSYLFQNSPLIALSKKAPHKLEESCLYLSTNEHNGPIDLMIRKLGVQCRKAYDKQAFEADPGGILSSTQFKSEKERTGVFRLEPLRYGYDMYDDILFVKKSYYKRDKVAVRKFVLATLQGWRYALEHIDEAARIIHQKYAPELSVEELRKQAKEIRAYSVLSLQKVGLFNPQRMRRICSLYKESGALEREVDIYDFIDPLFIDALPLSFKQRQLIASTPVLYSETTWPPFVIVDKRHKVSGMAEDFIDLVRRRTGLDMRFVYEKSWVDVLEHIKEGSLDMAMATGETPERRKYAIFTKPYEIYDFAIASRREHIFSDIKELQGRRVAVGKEYTAEAMVRKDPKIELVSVETTAKALALLEAGEVDAVVDIFPVASYEIVRGQYRDIVISGKLPEKFALRAMFRKELEGVRDIFDLALDSISKEERARIEKRYDSKIVYVISVQKERYFMIVIALLALFLVVAIIFGIRFKREIRKRVAAQKLLREQAIRDPLTQLYNRRFFNTFIEAELALMRRYGGMFFFGIFDIDNFKLYNDRYGHLRGDQALRSIAKKLKEICQRESDFIFRLGGEEFGLYIRLNNEDEIQKRIEYIVEAIEALAIKHPGNKPYGVVTISFGALLVKVEPNAHLTLQDIYKEADELMYEAKRGGKNRIVFRKLLFSVH